MPFQSEKQRRYMHANLPEIAQRWERDYAGGGIASQGGMDNYMGQQPMVNAPQQWQSGPDAPSTELAYITQPEKNLILQSNIHGSLQNGPNEGPSGIMSLDGQGDYTRDRSPAGRRSSPGGPDRSRIAQDKHEDLMRSILTGQKDIGQTSAVSERTRRGAVPEYAYTPSGERKYVGSSIKGKRGFFSRLFNRPNVYGTGSIRFNKGTGRYESEDERLGEEKPGYGGRILGGLMSLLTGIPVVGGAIGSAYDYGKGIFGKKPRDMSEFNQLSLTAPEDQKAYLPQGSDMPMARMDRWTDPISTPAAYDDMTGNVSLSKQLANRTNYPAYEEFAPNRPQSIDSYDPKDTSTWFDTHPATGESVMTPGMEKMYTEGMERQYPNMYNELNPVDIEDSYSYVDQSLGDSSRVKMNPYSYNSNQGGIPNTNQGGVFRDKVLPFFRNFPQM
jgi:hypothetical protein